MAHQTHPVKSIICSISPAIRRSGGICIVALACLICSLVATPTFADDLQGPALLRALEQSIVAAVEKAEGSVVSIARESIPRDLPVDQQVGNRIGAPLVFGPDADDPDIHDPDYIPNDFGSGVILGEIVVNGRAVTAILTNYHVVKGAEAMSGQTPIASRLSVRLDGKSRGREAKIWAADPRSDLAVIVVDARGLPAIKIAKSHEFKKGQFVLALGNPLGTAMEGGSASVSWGIVSNINRRANGQIANPDGTAVDPRRSGNERLYHLGRVLQVDANLNLGISGGALLNIDGELIGITTALAALAGYEKSAGYAIPMDETTQRIVETLLKGHEVEYGFLGVGLTQGTAARFAGVPAVEGAEISNVLPNLPASEGGLIQGDVITEIDGRKIANHTELMREIGRRAPGSTVQLRIYRQTAPRPQFKNVVLGKWPARNEDEIIAPIPRYGGAWRGITVDYSSGRNKFFPATDGPPRGVLVIDVAANSPAQRADIRPGDYISHVNGRDVLSPQDFHREVAGSDGAVDVQRVRNQESQRIAIEAD